MIKYCIVIQLILIDMLYYLMLETMLVVKIKIDLYPSLFISIK